MDKFFTGVVVGFFACLLINQHRSQQNKDGGIHFLKKDAPLRPGAVMSGFISQNRSL